jgi:hypothetical protein
MMQAETPDLDVPRSVSETMKTKPVGKRRDVHSSREILLVREDEEHRITQFGLACQPLDILAYLGDPVDVVGIDDEDNGLRVLEI